MQWGGGGVPHAEGVNEACTSDIGSKNKKGCQNML